MASTTNYVEIQQNEIDALQSIFMEDFVEDETKAGPWNKTADRSFRITIKPQSDNSGEVAATLKVLLPATYPKTLPRCDVVCNDGIPEKTKKEVNEVVKSKPKSLLGSEMIFELATSIADILEDVLQAQTTTNEVPALYEERTLQDAAVRQQAERIEQDRLRQEDEARREEQRTLAIMVEKEQTRIAKLQIKSPSASDSFEPVLEVLGGLTFDQQIRAKNPKGAVMIFRTVHNKVKFRNGPITEVFTVQSLGSEGDCAPFLALKECVVSSRGSDERLKKAVQSLETSLEALVLLPPHPSILKPHGFRVQQMSTVAETKMASWRVSILTDLATKGSMKDLLEMIGVSDIKNIRSWVIQLIEAVDFYHRHRIVHARIRLENVLFESDESGTATVKLADGVFQNDLHRMKDESNVYSTATSAYWMAPEVSNSTTCCPSSSKDIWDLGVLILQMVFGLDVQRVYSSPNSLIDALELSRSFEDLLSQMFKADPRKRPSAFDLLPNEFLRSDDPVIEQPFPSAISRMTSSTSITPSRYLRPRHDSTNVTTTASRYQNDFVEAGRLGKGGFGEVVRARNKLDGRFYAIKKIAQRSASALSGVLSEIILLSSMNHPNVVRYYTAWIEEQRSEDPHVHSTDSDESETPSISHLGSSRIEFGHSTPGLDFVSESGYPQIEFGYESGDDEHDSEAVNDDSAEEAEDDEVHAQKDRTAQADRNTQRRRRSSAQPPTKTILYIQMEYCEKQTLRDLIRNDLYLDVEECWRLFRQILEGLVHVHGHGIIHRDLKPDNVFIDSLNNVRLGDFGLARPGDYQASNKIASSITVDPSLTRSIGTSVYVAPEVRSSGGGHYNEKADMYSLGIILFEMSFPLKTGMERADILGQLRGVSCTLPSAFDQPEKSTQADIITSLVRHKVSERPSSLELLRSGKVPLQVEDEMIRTALQGISDTASPYYTKLLAALFSSKQGEETVVKDYTYDMPSGPSLSSSDLLLQKTVKEKLTELFRRHGAVETHRPLLIPNSRYYSNAAARLLDASGTLVQLPYDLTLPNARLLAKHAPVARKTYAFADVYRGALVSSHPKSHGEVDFDIVSYDNLDLALREAEVIKVMDEIIDIFPSLDSAKMCFHIGHSHLLDSILTICGITEDKWGVVKEILSKLNIGQWTWAKIRNELRAPGIAIASTSLDDLVRFDFRDTFEKAIPQLRSFLRNTDELESTFLHLEAVITYLSRFKVKRKVYINPLSSLNEKFYGGSILFQCIFSTKNRSVLAAGGRYDHLIQQHRPNTKIENRHAVGFNLGWERLFASMVRYQSNTARSFLKKGEEVSHNSWTPRRCDVLVEGIDSATLRTTGIKVVQELWAAGISAELSVDAEKNTRGTTQQVSIEDDTYGWTLNIKQDDLLRVRSSIRKEDTEVRLSELISYLRSEMRDRDRQEGRSVERTRPPRHSSHLDSIGSSNDREPDVRVLISQSKSKKSNRRNVIEDAVSRTHELVHGFLDGPIAAVEMKDDIFEGLRDTRLSDPDSWRRLIQNAPLAERQYLGSLHELLDDLANEAKGPSKNAFIYNFRTRACIYYDLWRAS